MLRVCGIILCCLIGYASSSSAQNYKKGDPVYILQELSELSKEDVDNYGGSYYPKGCYGIYHPTYETRIYSNNPLHPRDNGYTSCTKCNPSSKNIFVYWSDKGDPDGEKRFHRTDVCENLKYMVVRLSRKEAEERGFAPFSDCFEAELGELPILE